LLRARRGARALRAHNRPEALKDNYTSVCHVRVPARYGLRAAGRVPARIPGVPGSSRSLSAADRGVSDCVVQSRHLRHDAASGGNRPAEMPCTAGWLERCRSQVSGRATALAVLGVDLGGRGGCYIMPDQSYGRPQRGRNPEPKSALRPWPISITAKSPAARCRRRIAYLDPRSPTWDAYFKLRHNA
jgi:hypothetical protein